MTVPTMTVVLALGTPDKRHHSMSVVKNIVRPEVRQAYVEAVTEQLNEIALHTKAASWDAELFFNLATKSKLGLVSISASLLHTELSPSVSWIA